MEDDTEVLWSGKIYGWEGDEMVWNEQEKQMLVNITCHYQVLFQEPQF